VTEARNDLRSPYLSLDPTLGATPRATGRSGERPKVVPGLLSAEPFSVFGLGFCPHMIVASIFQCTTLYPRCTREWSASSFKLERLPPWTGVRPGWPRGWPAAALTAEWRLPRPVPGPIGGGRASPCLGGPSVALPGHAIVALPPALLSGWFGVYYSPNPPVKGALPPRWGTPIIWGFNTPPTQPKVKGWAQTEPVSPPAKGVHP